MSRLNFFEDHIDYVTIIRVGERGQRPVGYKVYIGFKAPLENRKVIMSADNIHEARSKAGYYIKTCKYRLGDRYYKNTGTVV